MYVVPFISLKEHHLIDMLLVLLSYLDRSNIGNARIAGMSKDLSLTGDRYDWLLTIFYISYIVFQFQVCIFPTCPNLRSILTILQGFMWKIMYGSQSRRWISVTDAN